MKKNSIANQLLFYILIASSFFTILATLAQIWVDYKKDLAGLKNRIIQVEKSYINSLAVSLWNMNNEHVRTQLNGILNLPEISYIEVITSDEKISAGKNQANKNKVSFEFPIIYTDSYRHSSPKQLGTLIIHANQQYIIQRLTQRIFVILGAQTVKTFSVSIFILFIIWNIITKYLYKMAQYTENLTFNNLEEPLILSSNKNTQNELFMVADSINRMRENLNDANKKLKEHKQNLEQQVQERTKTLELQTQELIIAKNKADEAAKVKSEFLANMSHEIRTPMNAIMGLTSLTLETELNHTQRDYLLKVSEASKHLLMIINDILDFSKIEAGKMELENKNFVLHDVIEKITTMFRLSINERNLEFYSIIEKNVPSNLKGDQLRLGQILINLVSNAVKFTDSGQIVIEIKKTNIKQNTSNKIFLLFSVSDTGIGIEETHLGLLFQAFTQTDGSITRKYGGTGLGLSICHRLLNLMGGKIWVESQFEKGSVFHFTIPFETHDEINDGILLNLPQNLESIRAGIIIKNQNQKKLIQKFLQQINLDFTFLNSSNDISSANPDLIIIDKETAIIDKETLDNLEKHNSLNLTKTIFITRQVENNFHQDYENKLYIQKPFAISELLKAIALLFNEKENLPKSISPEKSSFLKNAKIIEGATILVVDDNKVNQKVASLILKKAGVYTEVAGNGKEAVELLEQRVNDKTRPFFDIILMDIEMPVMDGYKAVSLIKQNKLFQNLPIIAMTAHALEENMKECFQKGMDDYITKPVIEKDLFEKLANWISKKEY